MSTAITLVPPQGDSPESPATILQELLAATRELFKAGPVLEQTVGAGDDTRALLSAATIVNSARRVLLDWYGDGGTHLLELGNEIWELNLNLDPGVLDAQGRTSFPVFTYNVRSQTSGLVLAQAITWIITTLEGEADLRRLSDWRYEHREKLEWLREHPTPIPRRRRRATGATGSTRS